jgi:hypothetical protein
MSILPPEKICRLHKALEPLHRQYDSPVGLLKVPFQSSGAFKLLQGFSVHPTRESLSYAVALLDTGEQNMYQRAIRILQGILPLQDRNPNSRTYGVWPKYLEAKLLKIVKPDPNWCEFLSQHLLRIALHHRDSLPPKLITQVDSAILHAARAIRQRDVPYEYTNIAAMGIYVTLIAAQIYRITDLYEYALTRLRGFHDYTIEQSGFSEYNSPTYVIVTLKILGRLRQDVVAFEAKKLAENLYQLTWKEIAYHFHPSILQWAGPHSRSYSTLLETDVIALIERSTSEQINFGIADAHPTIDEHWLLLPCPPDLEPFFGLWIQPRTVSQTLTHKVPKQILTTYLDPAFSLGTINYSDFWCQRRPLVVYWGIPSKPGYLRLRCLHNGIDFAAAQFFSIQHEGNVLAGVSFANDIHPVNPYVDWDKIRDLKVSLTDLRLRFELGGSFNADELLAQLSPRMDLKSPIQFYLSSLCFQVLVPYARFGHTSGRWEIHQGESCCYLDVVLWSGRKRTFALSGLGECAIGFALQITTENTSTSEVLIDTSNNWLEMNWNGLILKLQTQSANQSSLNISTSSRRQ